MLRLLILFVGLLIPVSAVADDPAWLTNPSGGVTVLHSHPGVDYLYDDKGHTATIYGTDPGMRWYSTQDSHTGKTTQGYFFNPSARSAPLRAPESLAYPPLHPPAEIRR